MTPSAAGTVAAQLNLRLLDRLAGGEFGAYRTEDERGRPAVLKVLAPHPADNLEGVARAIELAEQLRRAGYPVPRYQDVGFVDGFVYTLQELLPGSVPESLSRSHAQQLAELWSMQIGTVRTGSAWPAELVTALCSGTESLYVNHSVVRAAGSRAAGLLDEIVEVGTRVDVADFHNDDVVHGDFHHRNILVGGDRVTAVVDWEGARAGDARLDIAKLAFWSETVGRFPAEPDAAIYLKGFAELHIPPAVDAALAGLLALQQVNFAARSRPELREWSLEVVERILAPHWRL